MTTVIRFICIFLIVLNVICYALKIFIPVGIEFSLWAFHILILVYFYGPQKSF
jgi:hypothetical protein